jgi:hypothetical protein
MNEKVNAPEQRGNQRFSYFAVITCKDSKIRKNSKLHSVVSYLVNGNRIHRFQAEKICRDHVLPSTIAGFQRVFGIPVNREYVTVYGFGGSKVRVAEYWMDADSIEAARKLLEGA